MLAQAPANVCPCCGGSIKGRIPFADLSRFVHLRGGGTIFPRIVDALVRRQGAWVDMDDLVDHVYSNRPDGGPLTAADSIRTYVCKYRASLQGSGWKLEAKKHYGYRITADVEEVDGVQLRLMF